MNSACKKQILGQYFTKKVFWLHEHILSFIQSTRAEIAFDPFAGSGELLKVAKEIGFKKTKGFDIDPAQNWEVNDSLLNIPKIPNSIIITNPPYLTNYSAKRKGVYGDVKEYFDLCKYDDIYQLAIEKCLINDYGVMIVPETFINSSFPKSRMRSITIIEDNPFSDTETPVCVVCFDKGEKTNEQIYIYQNDIKLGNLGHFEEMRLKPHKNLYIKFNSPSGKIALRAVDTTDPKNKIAFMKPENIDYESSDIKHSSRLITFIDMTIDMSLLDLLIKKSNKSLKCFRSATHDVLLSPFKGNMKNGRRRRRLDYMTARAILEKAYESVCPNIRLFNDETN